MILYFSGNGNTESVAKALAKSLSDDSLIRIDKSLIKNPRISTDPSVKRIVWVLPVHAWGLPVAVRDFMKEVNVSNKTLPHYLVVTCGDDTGYIDKEWRGLMKRAGVITHGCWHVIMPNTFVTLPGFDVDDDAAAREKLKGSTDRIKYISEAIASGSSETDLHRGKSVLDAWFKTYILRFGFRMFCMSPRWFRANDKCTSCGVCVKTCPLKNIELNTDGRPEWGSDCTFCLGCYNHCPHHAVQYGKFTENKGQYTRNSCSPSPGK